MATDGGTELLLHLVASQPDSPSAVLALAPTRLSVANCVRSARISRVQVWRLLSLAEQIGLLERVAPARVVPTQGLADSFAWVIAANLQVLRLMAETLLGSQGPNAAGPDRLATG